MLVDNGDRVVVVELEGFLFFGTGDAVSRTVTALPGLERRRMGDHRPHPRERGGFVGRRLVRTARAMGPAGRRRHRLGLRGSPNVRRALSPLADR